MRKSGLRLDSEIGTLHLDPVQVVADAGEIAAADAIIFAVKMGDTENAARSLQPLVAKGATVFTFQNGVESAERIGRILGAGNVVPGVARIGSHISEPGVVKQIGTFARPGVRREQWQAERADGRLSRRLQRGRASRPRSPPTSSARSG
jgi:2-dehydropantoate 2-reductase